MVAAEMFDLDLLEALKAMGPRDTTGTETLQRYIYQCKVAVQRWLGTLAYDTECWILCEYVDDITLVTESEITFCQVKTRDRGAWTAPMVLKRGGGLDALVRSYNHAKAAGRCDDVRLELILEGPAGPKQNTQTFFANPVDATASQQSKLLALGLQTDDTADFLSRLKITSQYHARQSIDGVTLQMLMAIAPGHSSTIQAVYDTLLDRALAAQIGLAAQASGEIPLVLQPQMKPEESSDLEGHALSRSELLGLLPPSPHLAPEQRRLLEAANGGVLGMTHLEFKLRVAGGKDKTIDRATSRRAIASAMLVSRAALTDETDAPIIELEERLLEYADSVTADVVATAATAAVRIQPAEVIWGRLIQQVEALGKLDRNRVFDGDGYKVLGYLCDLSDRCLFAWRE